MGGGVWGCGLNHPIPSFCYTEYNTSFYDALYSVSYGDGMEW